MTIPEILQLSSVFIAVAAIIIGPTISLNIAKKQTETSKDIANLQARTNVLSKSRQDWINSLRTEIAGFMATTNLILPVLISQQKSEEMSKLLGQMSLHHSKAKLLINPKEKDHQAIVDKMEEISRHVLSFKGQPNELTGELTELSQKVLKREWERVKEFV